MTRKMTPLALAAPACLLTPLSFASAHTFGTTSIIELGATNVDEPLFTAAQIKFNKAELAADANPSDPLFTAADPKANAGKKFVLTDPEVVFDAMLAKLKAQGVLMSGYDDGKQIFAVSAGDGDKAWPAARAKMLGGINFHVSTETLVDEEGAGLASHAMSLSNNVAEMASAMA